MSKFSDTVTNGKNLVALLRDLLIFVLVIFLLVWPGRFKDRLATAGFREGDMMGFKWKAADIDKTANSLNESKVTIDNLKEQLNNTTKLLEQARVRVTDPQFKDSAAKLAAQNNVSIASANSTQRMVKRTIADVAPMIKEAQEVASTTNKWGIVWSGDVTLDKAKYEMGPQVAGKLNLPNPNIYYRQNSYRSVSIVDDRDLADEVLKRAKNRRSDAYIVTMSSWCPSPEKREGYIECRGQ